MFFVCHPQSFVVSPIETVPADFDGFHYSIEKAVAAATPAAPAIWQAQLVGKDDLRGTRTIRLVRFKGHAGKLRHEYQPLLSYLPEPPLILSSLAA